MKIFHYLIHIENLTKKKKKIVEIERIVCFETRCIFLVDFEYDRLRIGIDGGRIFARCESLPFCS